MYCTSDVFFLSLWQWPCSTWTRYEIPHHSCSEACAPDDCFYWQEMRWQIKTLCFPLRIAVSCDMALFGTQVEVTDLIQAFAMVLVRWTLVILDGTNATVTFLFNIDKGTHDMLHFHILYLMFPFAVSTPSTKTFQTALFSGQVCNLMELCWEKLINSFLSVKSREELDLILAALAKSQLVLVLSYDLWLIHNWFIGLADRKCFRRLFFLASMSGVSLPWHNVPMSGWQRSGLSWSQRCRPWLSLVYLIWKHLFSWTGRHGFLMVHLGKVCSFCVLCQIDDKHSKIYTKMMLVTTCWIYECLIVCLLVQKCKPFVQAHVGSRHKEQQLERTVYSKICKND